MALSTTWETILPDITEKVFASVTTAKKATLTGGSTTTLVSSAHVFGGTGANAYDGVRAFILDTTDDAAPKGEERRVSAGGFTGSTGTWTVGTAYSAAPESGDVVLFLYGFAHQDVLDAANRVQNANFWPRYVALSLVTDANMEDSGVASWVDVSGTPTQTKETTIVLTGKQSLKIVTTVLDESVRSVSVPVTENTTLYVSVPVKLTAGSLRVQLYDVTNGAEIHGTTVDEEDWTEVRFNDTVPANCQNVQVRFIAKTAATTAYVDHVSLLPAGREVYNLPVFTDMEHVEGLYYQMPGTASEAEHAYRAFEKRLQRWPDYESLTDYAGVNSHRIQTHCGGYPLWVKGFQKDAEFTGLSSTTFAPPDAIVWGTVAELQETQAGRLSGRFMQAKFAEAAQSRQRYQACLPEGMGRPMVEFGGFERVRLP